MNPVHGVGAFVHMTSVSTAYGAQTLGTGVSRRRFLLQYFLQDVDTFNPGTLQVSTRLSTLVSILKLEYLTGRISAADMYEAGM